MAQQFKDSLNTFNFKLLNVICNGAVEGGDNVKTTDNVFYSPISISTSLGMVLAGSDGNTKNELMKALGLDVINDTERLLTYFEKIISGYSSAKDDKSRIMANKMVIHDTFEVNHGFKSSISKHFHAEVDRHSLVSPSVVPLVNNWVKTKTNGMIKTLINKPCHEDDRLILLNAIYFKDDWTNKFNPRKTTKKVFKNIDGSNTVVDMMSKQCKMDYFVNDQFNYSMLEIHYKAKTDCGGASMVIVLPKAVKGILSLLSNKSAMDAIMEDAIVNINYDDYDGGRVKVLLELPKFKLEGNYELIDTLKRVGIVDLFDEFKNNLSRISSELLHVASAVHKATVVVNEEGSEAAAVTSHWPAAGGCAAQPVVKFNCDHPFMFMIKQHDLILFTGVMFNM